MSSSSSLIISKSNTKVVGSTYTLELPRQIEFKNKEIALVSSQFYYSNPNITSSYGNNTLRVRFKKNNIASFIDITFPDGYYSYNDITGYIQQQLLLNNVFFLDSSGTQVYPISIVENSVYYSATISFIVYGTLPSGWTNPNLISLTETFQFEISSAFGKLIGFNPQTLPAVVGSSSVSFNSNFTPQISPVEAYCININLINEVDYYNSYYNTLHVMNNQDTVYGGLINENISYPTFYRIQDGFYKRIVMTITAQDGNTQIPMLDTSGTIMRFHIRSIEK